MVRVVWLASPRQSLPSPGFTSPQCPWRNEGSSFSFCRTRSATIPGQSGPAASSAKQTAWAEK